MHFSWDEENRDHIAKHHVSTEEAEWVVDHATPPYPEPKSDDKYVVLGQTRTGRYLQVIFVYHSVSTIDPSDLTFEQLGALQDRDDLMYVIHARDLELHEKRRLNRRRK